MNNLPNCIPQDIYEPDEESAEDLMSKYDELDALDLFEIDRELAMLNKIEQEVKYEHC